MLCLKETPRSRREHLHSALPPRHSALVRGIAVIRLDVFFRSKYNT